MEHVVGESLKEVPCQLLKEGHISLLDRCEAGGSVFGSTKWLLREWKASTGCVGVRRTVLTQLKKKKKQWHCNSEPQEAASNDQNGTLADWVAATE